MIYKITCLFILTCLAATAQTRLISHKSHSGSNATFAVAFKDNLFDIGASNLGEAPRRQVTTAKLDSVIYIAPGKALMVTSNYCSYKSYGDETESPKTLWRAGRDTVYNHPLFSRRHALDSIRRQLKQEYYFKNDIDSTVFIGFDNKDARKSKKKKRSIAPPLYDNGRFPSAPILVFALALLSAVLGFVVHYHHKTSSVRLL